MNDSLFKYHGHEVQLIDIDGKEWNGFVVCVESELDSDTGEEELDLDHGQKYYTCFKRSEIKSIKIAE